MAVCVALGGCAGTGANGAAPTTQATLANDTFKPYTEVSTVTLQQGRMPEIMTLQLHARRDRASGVTSMHARVNIGYLAHSARRYNDARNERAQILKLTSLSRMHPSCTKSDGCLHREEYLIDIPEAELRAARQTGYRFKILSRSTPEKLVAVPAKLIAQLYEALDRQGASVATAKR